VRAIKLVAFQDKNWFKEKTMEKKTEVEFMTVKSMIKTTLRSEALQWPSIRRIPIFFRLASSFKQAGYPVFPVSSFSKI